MPDRGVWKAAGKRLRQIRYGPRLLLTDEDQDAGCQRQECDHDARQRKMKECRDSDKNQIDREKEHSEVFGDVHGFLLRQGHHVCTLKLRAAFRFKPR
jgi:hypothetical protein